MVAAAALFYPHPPVCGVVNAGSVWPWLCVRCCKPCWKKKRPVINLLISVFGFLSPCRLLLVCVHGAQLWLGGWALFLVRLKCIHTRAHTYSAIPQGAPGIIFNCDNESKKKKKAEFPKVSFRKPQGGWKWGFGLNLSANQQAWKSNMFLKTAGRTSFVRSWHYHCFIRWEGFGGLGLRLSWNFGDGFKLGSVWWSPTCTIEMIYH